MYNTDFHSITIDCCGNVVRFPFKVGTVSTIFGERENRTEEQKCRTMQKKRNLTNGTSNTEPKQMLL